MGEQKGADQKSDAGEKKDAVPVTAIYKVDLHCEGCAKKLRKSVKLFDGVTDARTDYTSSKLTAIGKIDPASFRQWLEQRTKKKVELVSPPPKKDAGDDGKKTDTAKKPEEKKADDKKSPPKETSLVLKIKLHCEGCIVKIRKKIMKIEGVKGVSIDAVKDLVTLKGTMNVKEVVPFLKYKFKRNVEVVPPKKDDAGKEKAAADGEKKEGAGGAKAESAKMEYYGHPPATYSYWPDGHVPMANYGVEAQQQGYVDHGYAAMPGQYHAPQMFSDENPNACSVM